jgi:hypothetical protein
MIDIIGCARDRSLAEDVLGRLPQALTALLERDRIRIHFLETTQTFDDLARSTYPTLGRTRSDVQPYGVYVPLDRVIIIRSRQPYVLAHETFHHADARLGNFDPDNRRITYRSERDETIGQTYRRHLRDGLTISAYAQLDQTEWWAESGRAAAGFSHPGSRRPDRERLARIDPKHLDLIDSWIAELPK